MRDGWTRVAFGDVARNITDRVDNPAKAGVDRYVGLEHLGSESLTISRWGLPTDVAATKLLFRRGDIILGRRRVYQRKLAVADFDGICSAHALVLRARSEAVDPDFLPYFMQTDSFMDRALQISVGSLSPTINWTALAREEFSLPPLATQRRLAGALSALDRAVDAVVGAMTRGHIAGESRLKASITGSRRSLRLGDATIAVEYGCSLPASDTPQGTPILRIPNVLRGELDLGGLKRLELSPDEVAKYAAHEGDILMVRTNGNPDYVGRCVLVPRLDEQMVFASYLIRIAIDQSVLEPAFVALLLNSRATRAQIRCSVRSSAGNYNINSKEIRDIQLPVPDRQLQLSVVADARLSTQCIAGLTRRLDDLKELRLELWRASV